MILTVKYGAILWTGDQDSTFKCLKTQIRQGLSMGLCGIPWWNTDIGGFHNGDINDLEFRQLIIRWFQFGCFCPVFRLHGYRLPFKKNSETMPRIGEFAAGVGIFQNGAQNEVWSFGEDNYEIMKKYLNVRERIKPYIKEQMRAAHEKGTPVIRPLFYDFYNDKRCHDIDDQYMFGYDILVAPIINKNQYRREVYLPVGRIWKNAIGSCEMTV